MAQTTAMQQFIEWVKYRRLKGRSSPLYDDFLDKATELLEVEKQQIKDAYCAPYNYEIKPPDDLSDSAETYYQSTYKSE